MSTFLTICTFELSYRLRQWPTWLYFAAMAAFTRLLLVELMIGEAQGTASSHANAPAVIAMVTTLATMLVLVASAGLFGDAAARDEESRMAPLLYTTPMSKRAYLAGRFAGAYIITALLLAVPAVGLMSVETMRDSQPQLFGAFRPLAYLQAYAVFGLPTAFATGAIIFAAAALSGRALAGYAAGVFLFFGSSAATRLFTGPWSAALADPFGLAALDHLTEYWTPFETNTRLMLLTGSILWNRAIWVAIGAVVFALTIFSFSGHSRRIVRRTSRLPNIETPDVLPGSGRLVLAEVRGAFTPGARLKQVIGIARRSLSDLFFRRYVIAGLVILLGRIVSAGWASAGIVLDTPTWPLTYIIATDVIADAGAVIILLGALLAGELVWRERDARSAQLTDVLPLPNWVPLTGKFVALVAAMALVQAALVAAAVLLQAMTGYHRFEPMLYLKIVFGFQLYGYVLWAALAMSIHVLANHKYVGHFIFVLCWGVFSLGRKTFGIEHNLLAYGASPGWSYSDLSGFEPFFMPWLWFKLYWTWWALLLLITATLFWTRGHYSAISERMRLARERVTRPVAAALAIGLFLLLGTGGWIFYNTNVINEHRTRDDANDLRADYERRYKRYDTLPQPHITDAKLRIEIHPERRALDIEGTYRLENLTTRAVETVHVLVPEVVEARTIALDRVAERLLYDPVHSYHIFRLARPLEPGGAMKLRFELRYERRGFTNRGADAEVVTNGTYLDRSWMPMIGYQRARELSDRQARQERDLPPRTRLAPLDDPAGRELTSAISDAHWLRLETVVGTSLDQTVVAPGTLRRTWTAGSRRYFHYATGVPIQNIYAIFSAEYSVRRDQWSGVDIEVFHHPGHTRNVDRILSAMKAALEYQSRNIGPYPHRHLRVVEFPRHRGTYARAYPTAVAMSEGFGFIARPEDGIDYPFLVAAHEVMHQWWGNQLRPALVEGNQVLTETLAHYGALMVMEATYGHDSLHEVRAMLLRNYLKGRRNHKTEEVPLLRSGDHGYIHYDKGAMVMYALREYIGEARVNTALRQLFERYPPGSRPYPSTQELYAELKNVTPEPLRYLLDDLFTRIVLWDLRAHSPQVEQLESGAFRVTFTVVADKVEADGTGRDRPVPMNDLIEVGVFSGTRGDGGPGEPLYLRMHRIRAGSQTITVTVPDAPSRVGIDPYRKLIERELTFDGSTDNLAEIAE